MSNSNIKIFESIAEFMKYRSSLHGSVGFVPTMGALHQGHASLLRQSVSENDFTVLSIYVNPTQFNNPEDLQKYPKTLDADLAMAKDCNVHAVILPQFQEIYADNYRYVISEKNFSNELCGAHRPGHFDGVLTVVMKLFNMVSPQKAYFGEKDFQQLLLIEDMVKTFFMKVQIVRGPTVREESGLAMSSRNTRLSNEGRKKAALIYQFLKNEKTIEDVKNQLLKNGFIIDYVEQKFNRRFVAATLENVRLIDNVEFKS